MMFSMGDSPTYVIREAVRADYEALCVLFEELDHLHADALPHLFRRVECGASGEFMRSRIRQEGSALFIADQEGALIGFAWVTVCEAPDIPIMGPRRYAMVEELAVKREFRRRGIGQALMAQTHQWAQAQGLDQVEVVVYDFNRAALALYEMLGYAVISHRLRRPLS